MITALTLVLLIAPSVASCDSSGDSLPPIECPKVLVVCPEDVFDDKPTLRFRARIEGLPSNQRIKYHWTVYWVPGFPKPKIKSGQGTSSIVVKASGPAWRGLTVTVAVIGLPKTCANEASCTTMIASLK
jgi:hypothetical protein